MRKTLIVIISAFLLGCNIRPESTIDSVNYFNIGELLNSEIAFLLKQNASLEKEVISNGESDVFQVSPNSQEEWESQFSLFLEANIDKPGLRDAYHEEELSPLDGVSSKIYSAKSKKNFVQTFELLYNNNTLKQINIRTQEENVIYTNNRTLRLFFDEQGEHILGFDVKGDEDMRLKDAMNIDIQAVITF